ncbi:MAG: hypothetical protein ACNA8W_16005 [Bradymonadaceae bacterium]
MSSLTKWVLLFSALTCLAVACGDSTPNNDGETRANAVDPTDYDQTCATNADCVQVSTCACECWDYCPDDGTINRSERERFESDREAIACAQALTQRLQGLSCDSGTAVCVEDSCRNAHIELPRHAPKPAEEWNRSCTEPRDCTIAPVHRCGVNHCGAEYVAVNREDEEHVYWSNVWDCDQFVDRSDECEPLPEGHRRRAFCEEDTCDWALVPTEPAETTNCHEIETSRDCTVAGCHPIDMRGARADGEDCVQESVFICIHPDEGIDEVDTTPRYHRDGVAVRLLTNSPFGDWKPCAGDAVPACVCLE